VRSIGAGLRAVGVAVGLGLVLACGGPTGAATVGAPAVQATPPPIDVPAQGAVVRVGQRSRAALPGSHDRVEVALGDITGGRVRVVVSRVGAGEATLATADAGQGDAVRFTLEGHGYALHVETLRNALVGDDWAELRLTADEPAAADTPVVDERARIEALLAVVRGSGIVFLRNGREHTAEEAATHLRDEWSNAGDRIATADDFIEQLASRSSQSGEAYRVRLPDGTERESGPWLREQLAALPQP
jgi:hypothetical protein